MKNEFPEHMAATEDVSSEYSSLDFWKRHETALPAWAEAAKKVILVQPSSAVVECICSRFCCCRTHMLPFEMLHWGAAA